MRWRLSCLLLAALMVALIAPGALAWEGRMTGMGDPYGLVGDESDFLTLPTRIVDGSGIKYYWDTRFMYHDISDLNWSASLDGPVTVLGTPLGLGLNAGGDWNSSGSMWEYSTQLGATLPVWAGRLGIFFKYSGQTSDFDGKQRVGAGLDGVGSLTARSIYDMDSSFDNFNFRLLYGQPIGTDLRIAGEIQLVYQQEENKYRSRLTRVAVEDDAGNSLPIPGLDLDMQNDFIGELFPFMKPFDDDYWEILFKTGLEGRFGPAWIGMAVRGGPIFSGDNTWRHSLDASADVLGTTLSASEGYRLDGGVDGWKLGGDFWVRYPISKTLSIPFTVRVDYSDKTRDGTGEGFISLTDGATLIEVSGYEWDYQNKEKRLFIEAGGGVEKQVTQDMKMAAGLYYDYIHNKESLALALDTGLEVLGAPLAAVWDNGKFPSLTEHLIKVKLLVEKEQGSCMYRAGLSMFGGWVSEDYASQLETPVLGGVSVLENRGALDGTTWGILGSFGATFHFRNMTLEPFLQAGYQEYHLNGPGSTSLLGNVASAPWALEKDSGQTVVGTGVSVAF